MTDRLSKSDWIAHGLSTLADKGPAGLKVGPMADALAVSRGSFYWHFGDIADFRTQLLAAWEASATEQVIQTLEAGAGPDRLRTLMRGAFGAPPILDQALRAWAVQDAEVAAVVAAADHRRVTYIAGMLAAAGVAPAPAQERATFLYWAYLGQAAVVDPRHASLPASALEAISDLFER